MAAHNFSIDDIDAALPQTQCGLCDYAGCRPYAEAITNNGESIDRCPPGGVSTLKKLADITGKDAAPYIKEMEAKQKPAMLAKIREAECIGCTKCIKVCPTDAIIGASKQMHTIIKKDCTGCELCVPACPVDCIDIIELASRSENEKEQLANNWRTRYEKHNARLARKKVQEKQVVQPLEERKLAIAEILKREKKRSSP